MIPSRAPDSEACIANTLKHPQRKWTAARDFNTRSYSCFSFSLYRRGNSSDVIASHRKAFATFRSARIDDLLAVASRHPSAEAVSPFAFQHAGLEGALHRSVVGRKGSGILRSPPGSVNLAKQCRCFFWRRVVVETCWGGMRVWKSPLMPWIGYGSLVQIACGKVQDSPMNIASIRGESSTGKVIHKLCNDSYTSFAHGVASLSVDRMRCNRANRLISNVADSAVLELDETVHGSLLIRSSRMCGKREA